MQQTQRPIVGALERVKVMPASGQSGTQYAVEELRKPDRLFLLPQGHKQRSLMVEQRVERKERAAA